MIDKDVLREAIFSGVFGMPCAQMLKTVSLMSDAEIEEKIDLWKGEKVARINEQISRLQSEASKLL